jgi:hypothetical protein
LDTLYERLKRTLKEKVLTTACSCKTSREGVAENKQRKNRNNLGMEMVMFLSMKMQ